MLRTLGEGHNLEVRGADIFCLACKKVVSSERKSHLTQHLNTRLHKECSERRAKRGASDTQVKESIFDWFKENPNVAGSSVSSEEQHFRYRVVQSMMYAGIPLQKADYLRPLFQRSGFALTDSSHLRGLVPLVEQHEIERVRADLVGQRISVAYDGTRRQGEALNVTGRYCTIDFHIQMRLLAFITAAKSYTADDLVRLLSPILMQVLLIQPDNIIGFSRDSVSANGLAMQTLCTIFGLAQDMPCISHTLMHVGEQFDFELLA